MKKTYNINISGNVFTIDDDAYTLLNDYLETLDHVFHNTDNEEIIPDIENRIAEIFSLQVAAGKAVIVLEDVESVIARIGKPEELVDITETETTNHQELDTNNGDTVDEVKETFEEEIVTPPPYVDSPSGQVKKKLFRDSQNGMLGGVCAGLAEYLNFDVTWIRLIAVGLVFLSFYSFISVLVFPTIYIILWIVLPNATTPLQRMQMMGDIPTLSNIGKSVTGQFRQNNNIENDQVESKTQENESKRIADNIAKFFGSVGKILLWVFAIIAIPIEIALGLGLIGSIFALILFGTTMGANFYFFNVPVSPAESKEIILGLYTAIGYIIVFSIPLYLLITLVLSPNKKPFGRVTKISMGIIWAIGFIAAAITTGLWISYDQIRSENDYFGNRSGNYIYTEGNSNEVEEVEGFKFIDEIDSTFDSIPVNTAPENTVKDSIPNVKLNSPAQVSSTKK